MNPARPASALLLTSFVSLACAPPSVSDAGVRAQPDAGVDAGSDGGVLPDAGPDEETEGPFLHPTSASVAEVIYSYQRANVDDFYEAPRLAAYMKDGTTLQLARRADAFEVSPDGNLLVYWHAHTGSVMVKSTYGGWSYEIAYPGTEYEWEGFGDLAFSLDGSVATFTFDRKLYVARTDGSGGITVEDLRVYWLSPDGSHLLVRRWHVSDPDDDAQLISTDTGQLLGTLGGFSEPQWAPDSSAFYASRLFDPYGRCESEVIRVAASDGAVTTPVECTAGEVKLSPSGTRLAFVSDGSGAGAGLFVSDLDGSNSLLVEPGFDPGGYRWLPDSTGIVYWDKTEDALQSVRVDGSDHVQIATLPESLDRSLGVLISPDGTMVAYAAGSDYDARALYAADPRASYSDSLMLPASTSTDFLNPRWSADGGCLGLLRHRSLFPAHTAGFVIDNEDRCSFVDSGAVTGALPAGHDMETLSSWGVGFAGGAIIARVESQEIVRQDAASNISILPGPVSRIYRVVAIDRFIGQGSEEAPERVKVHDITSR